MKKKETEIRLIPIWRDPVIVELTVELTREQDKKRRDRECFRDNSRKEHTKAKVKVRSSRTNKRKTFA